MNEHSPAPWALGLETTEETGQVIASDGSHIAYVECDPVLDNTRLIIAAPKMYDHHRANEADAAGIVEAIADQRWADARSLAGVVARRSEEAVRTAESEMVGEDWVARGLHFAASRCALCERRINRRDSGLCERCEATAKAHARLERDNREWEKDGKP